MTELAQGYLSLSVGMENAGDDLGKWLKSQQKTADAAGKAMGKALSQGVADGTEKAKAATESAKKAFEQASKAANDSSDKQAAANRKVEIAEAKLAEARQNSATKQSTLLSLEDRLATAKKSAERASLQLVAAQKKEADASAQVKRAQEAEAAASDKAASKSQSAMARMRSSISGVMQKVNPFSRMPSEAEEAGRESGRRFSSGVNSSAATAEKGISGFRTAVVGGLAGGLASAGAGAAMALGGMAKSAIQTGVSTAAANEQASISFTTMLGSAQKAKTFLADLNKFAAETPFDMPGLQTASSSLVSAGVDADKVIPIMRTLGDVTSGMGTGSEGIQRATVALQQMNAAQKISGEDLNQLRDAGIPVYDLLAAAMGKSKAEITDLASKGKLGKDALDKMMGALESGKGLERFSGLMDKQSQSLSGLWESFKDASSQGMAQLIQPFIPMLESAIKSGTSMASTVIPKITSGIKGVSTVVSPVISAFSTAKDAVNLKAGDTKGWDSVFDRFNKLPAPLRGVVTGALNLKNALTPFGNWIKSTLVPALKSFGESVGGSMRKAFSLVQQVVSQLWARIQPMMPQIKAVFGQIGGIITGALGLISAYFKFVVDGIQVMWSRWGSTILTVVTTVFRAVIGVIRPALSVISGVIKVFTSIFRGDWSGAWNGIKQITSGVWNTIKAVISGALSIIKLVLKAAMSVVSSVWRGAWNGIKSVASSVWGWIRDHTLTPMKNFFTVTLRNAFSSFGTHFGNVWKGLKKLAATPVNFIIGTVWNDGLRKALNLIPGVNLKEATKIKGYRTGGYTGGAPVDQAVGVVHGGEYVLTAHETARMGGPLGVEAWKRGIPGFASGGFVGGRGRLTDLAAARVAAAAASLGQTFQLAQRGWNAANGLSGTSHAGDAVDVSGPSGGTNLWKIRDALRKQNWAAWVRGPKQNFSWHVHAVPGPGAGTGRGSATYQWQDYLAGGAGLRGVGNPDPYRVPGPGTWLAQVASSVVSSVTDFFGSFKDKISGLKDKALKGLTTPWGKLLSGVPGFAIEKATAAAKNLAAKVIGSGTPGKSGNAESWRSMVAQALRITGIGGGKSDEDKWLRQIMSESSGNPNLIQSSALRDINVRNGDPARGLVQVPGVTWADFGKDQGPFLSNWMNPLKNLIVGMRAAFAQHGGARWRKVIGFGHGYASGTSFVPFDMLSPVGERGMELIAGPQVRALQRGSQVLSNADTRALLGGASGPMRVTGQLDITEDGKATLYGWMVDAMEDRESMMARIGA